VVIGGLFFVVSDSFKKNVKYRNVFIPLGGIKTLFMRKKKELESGARI